MPPFEYRTAVNPFAGSIGELLDHGGDAAALAARSIGNAVAAIPEQMQQQRRTAIVDEAAQRQLDEAKRKDLDESRARSVQSAMDIVLKGSLVKDPATGLTTYDRDKLQAGMTEVGVPQTALAQYLPVLEASDKAVTQAKALHVEALKHSAQLVDMTGNNPVVFKAEIQRGIANGLFTQQEAQPYLAAAEQDPTHIGRITAAMLGRDPNAGQFTLNPGDRRFDANGREIVANPKAPDAVNLEQKNVTLDGKPNQLVNFNPRTGQMFLPGSDQPIEASRIRGNTPASVIIHNSAGPAVQGDFEKTGDAFLATIPASARAIVKKIANYELDPTKVTAMRGNRREEIMEWAAQVNPEYDQANFAIRNPTRKAFTVGTQGQQINAINTALGHIHQLTTVSERLENGGFTPANEAWNSIRTLFGSDKVTNFDTLKDALSGEVASVLSKSGATVSGIAEAKEKIKAANSPTQLAGYVKTLIPVMGSKLAELNYQYHQAMGPNDPFSALSPESRQILSGLGFDPDQPQIGQQRNSPQQAREGETRAIPGVAGAEATFRGGKWVRTK